MNDTIYLLINRAYLRLCRWRLYRKEVGEVNLSVAEIKKGLECCQTEYERNCKECPYAKYKKTYITVDTCSSRLRKDVLDFTNRQQAEIEMLTARNFELSEKGEKVCIALKTAKSEAYKEFVTKAEKKAQNAQTWTGIEPVVTVSDLNNILKEMG